MREKKSKQKKNKTDKNKAKPIVQHGLKGTLETTRSGAGYVVVGDGKPDVFVRNSDLGIALNGDTVRVKLTKENPGTGKREGKVTEVVKRNDKDYVGTLQVSKHFAFFIPNADRAMPDFYIPIDKLNGAKDKDKVVAKLVNWDKGDKKPTGEIISVMDAHSENDFAMKEILVDNGFPLEFPADVLLDAERLPNTISLDEIAKRKDCRSIFTITIDPVDAKDFDDAISLRMLNNGLYEVGVHIADVSHYVDEDSPLDEEAYKRATSVYLPDRVNPMLPEHISNVLCSLRPQEEKLTFSAIFQMNEKGDVKNYWLGKTVIYSDHRFTYEEAQEIIEGADGKYKNEILLLNNISQRLRAKRFKKGAINFSSQEVRFKLDEKGKPIGIVVKESKEAHQLIEELMLLANRTVAENIGKQKSKKPIPFPYRVHDTPDEEKLTPFIAFAKRYGHNFDTSSPEAIAKSFNEMLKDVEGKPEQHVLEQLGIRTMSKAVYTTENIGHYGLGFEHYCHFTSPIRRYPDVLVHRVLQSVLEGKPMLDKKMEEKCTHSSNRERAAMESERAGNKYKQVEFMREHVGETFEGVVSGVASFGFFVETVNEKCEGLVSMQQLNEYDDFAVIEGDYSIVGRRSGKRFGMGDKVRIKLVSANLDKRQLDFEWLGE